ncbi:hypothetical protein AAG570_008231 [Ranatra chinensis]|uniref:CCR4-NOT transcription complex subunit 10 n=1 Tax=Ranatra chinensis TaxID=642074 RepID=A0ABD0XSK9_9HEMI
MKNGVNLLHFTGELSHGRPAVFQPEVVAKYKYNVGVSLLFASRPNEAFEYLTEASQIMHTSPLVWLRLAECCLCVHKPGNNSDHFDFQNRRKELVIGSVGTCPNKRLILNTNTCHDSAYSTEPQSYAIPAPNLDFALLCLRNAQRLLTNKYSKLKMAVYTTSAYVNLTIGNPVEALRDCMTVTDKNCDSQLYKYLARMYMAEALLMLDRIPDAISVLNPVHFKDFDPSQEYLLSQWCPHNKFCAQTVLQYNLAVALTIRGDVEKAADLLKRVWVARGANEIPIQVISLALYIELVLGK